MPVWSPLPAEQNSCIRPEHRGEPFLRLRLHARRSVLQDGSFPLRDTRTQVEIRHAIAALQQQKLGGHAPPEDLPPSIRKNMKSARDKSCRTRCVPSTSTGEETQA